jgi:hypothetical protein
MNSTDLSQLTIKELKSIASENDIKVTDDRRFKASWISAIEMWNQRSVAAFETPDPFEVDQSIGLPQPLMEAAVMAERSTTVLDLYMESDGSSSTSPTHHPPTLHPTPQPTTSQYREASIVVLIPLILLTVAVILIKIGITILIPLISSLIRFMGTLMKFTNTDRGNEPIDYFPPVAA